MKMAYGPAAEMVPGDVRRAGGGPTMEGCRFRVRAAARWNAGETGKDSHMPPKKATKSASVAVAAKAPKAAPAIVASTPVRNSPIPKVASAAPVAAKADVRQPRAFGHEDIAVRAYYIFQNGQGGSQDDHWYQAESELRAA